MLNAQLSIKLLKIMETSTKKGEFIASIVADFASLGINVKGEDIARRAIGSPDNFSRPYLWKKVEEFQKKTGKILFSKDTATPLKYLGHCMSIKRLDDFFSGDCPEIQALLEEQAVKETKTSKTPVNIKNIRESFLKKYADYCGLQANKELEEKPVRTCYLKGFEDTKDWKTPIFAVEDDINHVLKKKGLILEVQKDGSYLGWITDETTVGELADVFQVSVYQK